MDFTYYAAFALSIVIGFVGALIFILLRGRSYWRFALVTLVAAVFADFALLVNWRYANEMTAEFLLTDAAFFAGFGIVGCAIGALPVIGTRGINRLIRGSQAK